MSRRPPSENMLRNISFCVLTAFLSTLVFQRNNVHLLYQKNVAPVEEFAQTLENHINADCIIFYLDTVALFLTSAVILFVQNTLIGTFDIGPRIKRKPTLPPKQQQRQLINVNCHASANANFDELDDDVSSNESSLMSDTNTSDSN